MTERPAPERETTRRQLVHDYHRSYSNHWGREGLCRVRIFAARGEIPVVVVTEIKEKAGTLITNVTEYLAAEIIIRHFPERFEAVDPLIWIEHYPRTPEQRRQGLPALAQAEFSSFTPHAEYLGGIKRIRIGQPTWRHLDETEVEALIGSLDHNLRDS